MELAQHTVYQSAFVTVRDIFRDELSHPAVEQSLDNGSIAFIRYGLFALNDENGAILVDANYALFGNADRVVTGAGGAKGRCACTIVQYNEGAAKGMLRTLGQPRLCTTRAYLIQARILNNAWLGRPSRTIDEAASQLLSEVIGFANSERPPELQSPEIVRSIKALVNGTLSKPVSLAELGRAIYLSPFTVSRIFHRETGVSLREYIRRLRLRTALSRILDGVQPTDVARELGFYDESHFSKAFHAEFGSAPAFALGGACDKARR